MEMDEFVALCADTQLEADARLHQAIDILQRFCLENKDAFSFCDRGYPLFSKQAFIKVG